MRPLPRARDLVLLLARLVLGIVFIAHGWQKFADGLAATASGFDALGVPVPTLAAYYAAVVELVGGALLMVGLLTPLVGVLLFVDMLGAVVLVHAPNGVFVTDNGWELAAALGVASLLFLGTGAGRWSADRYVGGRARVS